MAVLCCQPAAEGWARRRERRPGCGAGHGGSPSFFPSLPPSSFPACLPPSDVPQPACPPWVERPSLSSQELRHQRSERGDPKGKRRLGGGKPGVCVCVGGVLPLFGESQGDLGRSVGIATCSPHLSVPRTVSGGLHRRRGDPCKIASGNARICACAM